MTADTCFKLSMASRGGAMSLSVADVCLIIIAVCAVILVVAGANAI